MATTQIKQQEQQHFNITPKFERLMLNIITKHYDDDRLHLAFLLKGV
jgi:hypothetical protein